VSSEDKSAFGPAGVSRAGEAIPWFDGALDEEDTPIEELDEIEELEGLQLVSPTTRPPPVPPAAPGAVRAGSRLRDEGEIARGGMGSIRRIYDLELRRHIAMKVIDPSLNDPDAAQRFLDEARITGRLDHANIIPVHDLVIDDRGVASYTMKLVDGQTLTALIAAQKTQRDLERILQSLIKVCDALSFAHSRGVIHRDLKPDNVMVGDFGQVYVMDWGCAQVVGSDRSLVDGRVEPDGIVLGTVQYMAPEQARGLVSQLDQRTDVFALGAILYKVLTGSAPYPGPIMQALPMAQRAQFRHPDECGGLAVKPPPNLSQIALKAMELDPARRYQTAEQFAEDLRAFLRGGNWFPLQKFAAGAVIVREGDRAEAAYIITAGRCEVRKRDPNDASRSITLRTLNAGDVFGETAIFADAPRSATVVALDEVSAVVVERSALDGLVRSSWLGLFVKALADRFLDVDARLSKLR